MANIRTGDEDRAAYWQAIRQAAEDVRAEAPSGEWEDEEEHVDSWAESLTIYTSDALTVLRFTENDEAAFDEGIYEMETIGEGIDSMGQLYTRIAWFAVRADIRRQVEALKYIDEVGA